MKTLNIILFLFILQIFSINSSAFASDRYTLDTKAIDMTKEELRDLELFTKILANHISKVAYRAQGIPRDTPIYAMNLKLEQGAAGVSITTTFEGSVHCTEDPPGHSCSGSCPCY